METSIGIYFQGRRKIMMSSTENSYSQGRDLNAGPPEYIEAIFGIVQMVISRFSSRRTVQYTWVDFRNI
jgi:hypothetical protein